MADASIVITMTYVCKTNYAIHQINDVLEVNTSETCSVLVSKVIRWIHVLFFINKQKRFRNINRKDWQSVLDQRSIDLTVWGLRIATWLNQWKEINEWLITAIFCGWNLFVIQFQKGSKSYNVFCASNLCSCNIPVSIYNFFLSAIFQPKKWTTANC